jgi:hypothetical protein
MATSSREAIILIHVGEHKKKALDRHDYPYLTGGLSMNLIL